MDEPIRERLPSDAPAPRSSTDEQRWVARVKELEWRADLAGLALAGDTRGLGALLAQRPGAAPAGDPQLQRELAKLKGGDPTFDTSPDEALAGYLDELERLCEAATAGPWELDSCELYVLAGAAQSLFDLETDDGGDATSAALAAGRFVVAARHALPKLIAKVRELEAELELVHQRVRFETTKDDRERQELGRELFGDEHA